MVESCGKFSYIAYPGCNCVCGLVGQRVAGVLSLRVQQLDVKVETKTSVRNTSMQQQILHRLLEVYLSTYCGQTRVITIQQCFSD